MEFYDNLRISWTSRFIKTYTAARQIYGMLQDPRVLYCQLQDKLIISVMLYTSTCVFV